MKMKALKPYILFFGIVLFIVLVVNIIKEITYNDYIIKNIKDGYKSLIIETYNSRAWIKEPSHIKVKVNNDVEKNIALGSKIIMDNITVGDSLIKIENENIFLLKKTNGETKEFYYVRIPKKNRSHWTFPKEWKNKWMESSAWDTLQ